MSKTTKKFLVTLTSPDGEVIKDNTNDIEECLLSYKPLFIKGKIIVNVKSKDKQIEKILFAPAARRVFYNPLALKIFVRDFNRVLQ